MNLNDEAGGDDIYLAIGRHAADAWEGDENPTDAYGGELVVNSRGRVNIAQFITGSVSGASGDGGYGTPPLVVNSGYVTVQDTLEGTIFYPSVNLDEGSQRPVHGYPDRDATDAEREEYQADQQWLELTYIDYIYYGNHQAGAVTVNGGTLQIGDGSGNFEWNIRGLWYAPNVRLAAGASLLSGDQLYVSEPGTQFRLEISGLPANIHLQPVRHTGTGEIMGDYANLDIWTNENGNFITCVTAADDGKQLLFADEENVWCYRIYVSDDTATATAVDLPMLENVSLTEEPLRLYPHYAVQGSQVYRYDGREMGLTDGTARAVSGGVQLMDNAQAVFLVQTDLSSGFSQAEDSRLTLRTEQVRAIPSITSTGESQLTLNGSGLTVTGAFQVGSLIILGGSRKAVNSMGGSGLGTTPVNGESQSLVPLAFAPSSMGEVWIQGKEWEVAALSDDGKLYLYLVSQATTITVNGQEYLAALASIQEAEHGSLGVYLQDGDTETRLQTGDMVLNGFRLRVVTEPEEGYGLRSGPVSGIYEARVVENRLMLYPVEQMGLDLWSGELWEAATNDILDADRNPTEVYGAKKTLEAGQSVSVELGCAQQGLAVAGVLAYGEGMTAEILVDGKVVRTEALGASETSILYDWQAEGSELISVRFSGNGTVTFVSGVLGVQTPVEEMSAEFATVYTLTLEQPGWEETEDPENPGQTEEPGQTEDPEAYGQKDENGLILALNEGGRNIRDRNLEMDGTIQFGAPQGEKKAGEYSGTVTFTISCQEEKE